MANIDAFMFDVRPRYMESYKVTFCMSDKIQCNMFITVSFFQIQPLATIAHSKTMKQSGSKQSKTHLCQY